MEETLINQSDSPKSSPPPQHGKLFFLSQSTLSDSVHSETINNLELPNLDISNFEVPVEEILHPNHSDSAEIPPQHLAKVEEIVPKIHIPEEENSLNIKLLTEPIAESVSMFCVFLTATGW